jgi:hypothetical protein
MSLITCVRRTLKTLLERWQVTRHYNTTEHNKQQAYRALLELGGERSEDGKFMILLENPTDHVAKVVGVSESHARNILRALKSEDLYQYVREGTDQYWRVRLPEGEQPQMQIEDVEESGVDADIARLTALFERLSDEMRNKDERIASLERQVAELEEGKQEHSRIVEQLRNLKVPEYIRNLVSHKE